MLTNRHQSFRINRLTATQHTFYVYTGVARRGIKKNCSEKRTVICKIGHMAQGGLMMGHTPNTG